MSLSSAEIKRQIIEENEKAEEEGKLHRPQGMGEGEILEIGKALEDMVRTKGWSIVESWMIIKMNVPSVYGGAKIDERMIGKGQGMMEVIQQVDKFIRLKKEIENRVSEEDG